jgi:Na+/melibiose symporter-like transporter|eukprot:evm.model.NODE_3053_length_17624_cov_21.646164.3
MNAPFFTLTGGSPSSSKDCNGDDDPTRHAQQPRVYAARYHQLALLCALILTNAVVWVAFSAITPATASTFGVSSAWINFVALSFQICFLPGTVVGYGLVERWGLRVTLLTGGVLTTVGAVLRLISLYVLPNSDGGGGGGYVLLLGGTCLAALAQPLLLNVPPELAGQWFAVKQRDVVTSLAFMCSPLGNAVGVTVAPAFVGAGDGGSGGTSARDGLRLFLLVQLVVVAATTVWAWLGVKDSPPTPPSRTAALLVQRQQDKQHDREHHHPPSIPTWQALKTDLHRCLVLNPSFRLLFVCFGLGLGFFNALLTLVGQLLSPCGYSDSESGALGGIFLGTGLIGALLAGLILDATHHYSLCLKGGFMGAWATSFLFISALRPNNLAFLATSFALLGFWMLPLLPVAIENGVEITYPEVPEFFSSGLLLSAGNLAGLPLASLFSLAINRYEERGGNCRVFWKPPAVFVFCVTTLCAFPILMYRPARFGRWEAEKQQRQQQCGASEGEEGEGQI